MPRKPSVKFQSDGSVEITEDNGSLTIDLDGDVTVSGDIVIKSANDPAKDVAKVAKVPAKSDPAKSAAQQPASVTLAHLYGYYGDDGLLRRWEQGAVVTDPSEISDLLARGAPLKG